MGPAIVVLGFLLFLIGLLVYIFVDFFSRCFKGNAGPDGDQKRLEPVSVRLLCAGFFIMWAGIVCVSIGF
jgi:uncharacterized membrane protein